MQVSALEKRKHPRSKICLQQRIVHVTPFKQLIRNFVLSKNISASGFSFSTPKSYESGSIFLVHLNDQAIEDLAINRARIMKYGNYFLARVIWEQENEETDHSLFDIGCSFLSLSEGNEEKLHLFNRLINFDASEQL